MVLKKNKGEFISIIDRSLSNSQEYNEMQFTEVWKSYDEYFDIIPWTLNF